MKYEWYIISQQMQGQTGLCVNLWLDIGVCCVQWTVYTYGKKGNEKVHEKKYLER